MTTDFRALIESLPDEAVVRLIEPFVRGLVHGLIAAAAANSDDIVARVLGEITDQLHAAAPAPEPESDSQAAVVIDNDRGETRKFEFTTNQPTPVRAVRDRVEHTCEICNRTGTRRFRQTPTGWRCSPTATACPGNREFPPPPAPPKPVATPAEHTLPKITPKPPPVTTPPAPPARPACDDNSPAITARCQDCRRVWTLTGHLLETAINIHESGTGHIVHIEDGAAD